MMPLIKWHIFLQHIQIFFSPAQINDSYGYFLNSVRFKETDNETNTK